MNGKAFEILPLRPDDRPWVAEFLREHWGSPEIVTRGRVHDGTALPGFKAVSGQTPVGLITYRMEAGECEIVSLDSLSEGVGVGTALIENVRRAAEKASCRRLWLITTNDNLYAVRFYQRRGFSLAALHRGALEVSRKLKPSIPLRGIDGIPLRDEIEMEILLESGSLPEETS